MYVERPKKAAPAKKMESCLRDRGAKIEEGERGLGWGDEGCEEVESDIASIEGF